jgi:hypothetical protein
VSEEAKSKKDPADAEQTPSGSALKAVGQPKEGASDEELSAHAEKYREAKLKARRG